MALVALAFASYHALGREDVAWALVVAAVLVSAWWQRDVGLEGTALEGPEGPPSRRRRLLGLALAAVGAALIAAGTRGLLANWSLGFDRAWVHWFTGTALLGWGLDLAWARWSSPPSPTRWRVVGVAAALVAAGALFRLGTFYFFPSPYFITQVEELQVGAMATEVLGGGRLRWEYLSQAWLGALGISIGGPTLLAIRLPSTILSFLKIVPLFLWLRFAVGTTGAVVGSLLLAVSAWDVLFARVPTNHDVFVVAAAFALLAGPARRGRPSAYAWIGLISGFVFFEYVLYRPLAVFALAGAFLVSWRDRHATWPARLARPLITVALLVAMTWPLASYIVGKGRTREFFDGWGRAQANRSYYNPEDTWEEALAKRLERTRLAAGLFFFRGAQAPVVNPKAEPLVDPFTSLLLVLGVGYGLAHPLRHLFGLTLLAGVFTLAASLIVTGNFDFVRAGSAVGYVFALAGIGAASLGAALAGAGPRCRRVLVAAALVAGTLYAALFSLRYLSYFVTSPDIRGAQFRELPYLASWIGTHVREGERVIIAAPNFDYMMRNHDAAWLRGKKRGAAFWDIHSALRDWAENPEPAILMVYGGATSEDVRAYLEWFLPEVPFAVEPGPLGPEKNLLWARASAPPRALRRRLAAWDCQAVAVEVELLDAEGGVVAAFEAAAGLIDPTLWPGAVRDAITRFGGQIVAARARIAGGFAVSEGGEVVFSVLHYPGHVTLKIDGVEVANTSAAAVDLAPGPHQVEILAEYDPKASAPIHRLYWQGPDSGGRRELLPFYRVGADRCG